jgi:hypothetical protein
MEVALRRRLEGVARIAISQQHQTAEVAFAPGPHVFSPEEFRAAVAEAEVEVISFEIEACGHVESGLPAEAGSNTAAKGGASGLRWFVAGRNRFLLSGELSSGGDQRCISAVFDERRGIYVRQVE